MPLTTSLNIMGLNDTLKGVNQGVFRSIFYTTGNSILITMKKISPLGGILVLTAMVFLMPHGAASARKGDPDGALRRLIRNSCASGHRPGIGVLSLKENRFILAMNLDKLYTPASNVKIITSLSALKKLKPDYTFSTAFLVDGPIKDGKLKGNLYIKGFGDPDLVPEQVWRMAVDLRNSGLHTIEGDLVADDSFFDDRLRGPGFNTKWSARAYHAPINALSVNFNTVTIKVLPGEREGDEASVYTDPNTRYIRLKSTATTGSPGSRSTITVNRRPIKRGDLVTVRGSIPLNREHEEHLINITKPTLFALTVFHETMRKEGVIITGEPRIGKAPLDAIIHLVHESRPLSLIVWGLNKFSNNFVAEQILKTLGAELKGAPGTFGKGIQVIQEYLEEIGIEPDSYVLVDGSGLSTRNRLSARQIIHALYTAYGDFEVGPEFTSSLAVMGVDGSLSDRLHDSPISRKVRSKTGSLNGVSALSGYAPLLQAGPVAFSILINGNSCDFYRAKELQDKILMLLFDSFNSAKH